MEKLKIPVSSIIADEIAGFILVEKETVKDCDVDFRDACASSAGGSECD